MVQTDKHIIPLCVKVYKWALHQCAVIKLIITRKIKKKYLFP